MNQREGINLVTELEAARILEGPGWTKVQCVECKGIGHFVISPAPELALEVQRMQTTRSCEQCESQGWVWLKPKQCLVSGGQT